MGSYVCRWVSNGCSIKDVIKAPTREAAYEEAKKVAQKNKWTLKAVIASWIELRSARPEKQ